MIQTIITVEDAAPAALLASVDLALSPFGLQSFLRTQVDPYIRLRAEQRFAMEGDDVTGPWAPLQTSTVAIRESLGFPGPGPINVRTGDLKEYVLRSPAHFAPFGGGAMMSVPGPPPSGSEAGAAYSTAQMGKSRPHTPPRPVLALGQTDKAAITMLLAYFVQDSVVGVMGAPRV